MLTLSLKAIPALCKHVSGICDEYEINPNEQLAADIRKSITKLDQFYLENENDPRAILIERLSFQLANILQRPPPPPKPVERYTCNLSPQICSSKEKVHDPIYEKKSVDHVASLSYAAAHATNYSFLSPFADTVESLTEEKSPPQVVVNFTVVVNDKDYFEIMRRREILRARAKGISKTSFKSAQRDIALYRREDPYHPDTAVTFRPEDKTKWVSKNGFQLK